MTVCPEALHGAWWVGSFCTFARPEKEGPTRLVSPAAGTNVTQLRSASLFRERNCKNHPTHHVLRLEIPFRAIRVRIMTTDARLRNRFIWIEGLKDGSAAFGRHPSIGTIGIHEDLRQAGLLEFGGWPILFVYRPIANQPESQPTSLCSYELPRFD